MKSDVQILLGLAASFLPFIALAFLNSRVNVKKENRNRQYIMPVFAVVYSVVLMVFLSKLSSLYAEKFLQIATLFEENGVTAASEFIRKIYETWGIYLELVLFNTATMLLYVVIKLGLTAALSAIKIQRNTFVGSVVELFYSYDEQDGRWYVKEHYGQACTFMKTVYYASCIASALALLVSCILCMGQLIKAPFYPVFAIIIIG